MSRPLILALALLFVGPAGCKSKENAAWKLPVDSKQLPGTANIVEAELIEGMRETDPHLKDAFTSAELGSEVCREGSPNPAHELELMTIFGTTLAKTFFAPSNLEAVQSLLDCGSVLASGLDGPFQTAVHFVDSAGAKAEIDVLTMKINELPPRYGLTKRAFGTRDGYCKTTDPLKPGVLLECTANSEAALKDGSRWFLGKRGELDEVAKSLAKPKAELSTGLAALNDAANEVEGLSTLRIESQLTTSKPFLAAPCAWGGFQTAGNTSDFVRGCFPESDAKVISEIDGKLKAAAFEIEPDVLKAGGVHGSIVLVARDDDGAKLIEKDAVELATDWKAQLDNNEGKLVKQAKTNAVSLRQRTWAIIVDNFMKAIRGIKVSRSGRVVKMRFNEALDPGDKGDLEEANKDTFDKRTAIADILGAIRTKQAVPVASLTKLVGAPWATYLVALSTFDPKKIPASCAKAPTPAPKKGKAQVVLPPDPACSPPVEPLLASFGDKK
jgi:hypothetical protein